MADAAWRLPGAFLNSLLDGWDAGSEGLATDDAISSVWRDTCGITLLQKLREGKLDSVASAICSIARPALKIEVGAVDSELPLGATKFGGKPVLSDGVPWPEYEGKLHTFVGQFNLEDLQQTQAGSALPSTGLLSFFLCDDPVDDGFRHLLTVASEDVLEWCWADGHQLFCSIRPEDLDACSFDGVAITDG